VIVRDVKDVGVALFSGCVDSELFLVK